MERLGETETLTFWKEKVSPALLCRLGSGKMGCRPLFKTKQNQHSHHPCHSHPATKLSSTTWEHQGRRRSLQRPPPHQHKFHYPQPQSSQQLHLHQRQNLASRARKSAVPVQTRKRCVLLCISRMAADRMFSIFTRLSLNASSSSTSDSTACTGVSRRRPW